MKPLLVLSIVIASCNTASPVEDDWNIEITTDGGITGRGLGGVSITPRSIEATDPGRTCKGELTAGERETLQRAIAGVRGTWKPEYVKPDNPHGHADQIRYTLMVRRGGESRSTSWFDESKSDLPADASAVFEASWRIRQRVVAECR